MTQIFELFFEYIRAHMYTRW